MDKKGVSRGFKIILGILIPLLVIVVLIWIGVLYSDEIISQMKSGTTSIGDFIGTNSKAVKEPLNYLSYIFGPIPNYLEQLTNNKWGPLIVILAIWFLIFVTFSDIIATFGTFSITVSWLIGALITIIAANLKGTIYITLLFTTIFATLGIIGVFLGLFTAFIAFVLVNWGVGSAGAWLGRRRSLLKIAKGTHRLTTGVQALTGVGREIEEAGN